jgi:hypothetical protein
MNEQASLADISFNENGQVDVANLESSMLIRFDVHPCDVVAVVLDGGLWPRMSPNQRFRVGFEG